MPPADITANIRSEIHDLIDRYCTGENPELPCVGAYIVGDGIRTQRKLFSYTRGSQKTSKTTSTRNIYWLASCTKLVTSIACMQLLEKGVLSLDDETQLETLCPELKDVRVAQDNGSVKEKTARITLRMLMTHTGNVECKRNNYYYATNFHKAGFGYSFLDPKLRAYCQRTGKECEFDEFSGQENHFQQPLVNNPGETFEYGVCDSSFQFHTIKVLTLALRSVWTGLE